MGERIAEIEKDLKYIIEPTGNWWFDFGDGPYGDMSVGIEAERPIAHSHYIAWLPSGEGAHDAVMLASIIAHMPKHLRYLLAENRRLREELDKRYHQALKGAG